MVWLLQKNFYKKVRSALEFQANFVTGLCMKGIAKFEIAFNRALSRINFPSHKTKPRNLTSNRAICDLESLILKPYFLSRVNTALKSGYELGDLELRL